MEFENGTGVLSEAGIDKAAAEANIVEALAAITAQKEGG
ncbi:hypothetical protein [Actinomadura welshii]